MIVTDTNSPDKDLKIIKEILKSSEVKNKVISINLKEFKDKIKDGYSKAKFSNMANFYNSLLIAKNEKADLIYFVEDDYLHKKESLKEMIFTYERISSQLNKDIIICPADYPYLYAKSDITQNFLGQNYHWRKVNETLCTFLTSRKMVEKYWDKYLSMCKKEHAPFEKPLHEIYEKELCISPIPSLAVHFTNINSIFGLSPNVDWEKIWKENEN